MLNCVSLKITSRSLLGKGWNLGSWFSGNIIKTDATGCQILRLKCTKIDFGRVSAPDRAGGANRAPKTP